MPCLHFGVRIIPVQGEMVDFFVTVVPDLLGRLPLQWMSLECRRDSSSSGGL